MHQLEEDGLLEKTIISFFSDHGDGLPRAKRWVYESGTRVPLIIRFPYQKGAGMTSDELISFIDFVPTMLSLLGQEAPDHLEGQVFLGAARVGPRRYVFNFRDRMDPAPETIRAVRDRRFRYVRNYRPELPYIGYIPYRDQLEMMQELLSLSREGKLEENRGQKSFLVPRIRATTSAFGSRNRERERAFVPCVLALLHYVCNDATCCVGLTIESAREMGK